MNNFNFTGVESAVENVFVKPGFQVLTITGLEGVKFNSGSSGFKVTFSSDKGGTFSQNWTIADANGVVMAKVAPSFQYLVEKFTGSKLDGEVNTASLSAKLVGKSRAVTVGGRLVTTQKDGKVYENTYAELPFAGYDGEVTPNIRDQRDQSLLSSASTDSNSGLDDLPF